MKGSSASRSESFFIEEVLRHLVESTLFQEKSPMLYDTMDAQDCTAARHPVELRIASIAALSRAALYFSRSAARDLA